MRNIVYTALCVFLIGLAHAENYKNTIQRLTSAGSLHSPVSVSRVYEKMPAPIWNAARMESLLQAIA
ncbi:hypothetical protein, partial [Litorivivens sp.]